MNSTDRLNALLSDILQNELTCSHGFYQGSLSPTISSLTFAEHDYYPSSVIPSVITTIPSSTSSSSITPLPTNRNSSFLQRQRHHHRTQQTALQKQSQLSQQQQQQQQQQKQPLLNSSTLDDLFRALTLECDQYLAASTSSPLFENKLHNPLIVKTLSNMQRSIDSNDDDYENLQSSNFPMPNGTSSLKTSIEVMSPEKRQIVSISVSAKKSVPSVVSASHTYPSISTSYTTKSMEQAINCFSSEEDSIDVLASNLNRKRRRRMRKQQIICATPRSDSSSDEPKEGMHGSIIDRKSTFPKRSFSTDYRQQRVKSIYDNHPTCLPPQKVSSRRMRRRDVSLQECSLHKKNYHEHTSSNFSEKHNSPLSVLLTSTQSTSDFVDHSKQSQRRARLELIDHQPVSLLDQMHHQLYRTSTTAQPSNNNNYSIPSHRIPSYPVY